MVGDAIRKAFDRWCKVYWLQVGFDAETKALLDAFCIDCGGARPQDVVYSLVRDVLVDDYAAHFGTVHENIDGGAAIH